MKLPSSNSVRRSFDSLALAQDDTFLLSFFEERATDLFS